MARRGCPLWLIPLGLACLFAGCRPPPTRESVTVERLSDREIRFPAIVNARGFEDPEMPGYHAVVWRNGAASDFALFQAEVSDLEVLDALVGLGASPGDNLELEAWDRRYDPEDPAPDSIIEGPPVEITVQRSLSQEPVPLASLLEDEGGRGIELRLGGNREHVPAWRSGCVVCLYSCPGSKVGNASYTVRDFIAGATRFRPRRDRLPEDGTRVWIRFRLADPLPD